MVYLFSVVDVNFFCINLVKQDIGFSLEKSKLVYISGTKIVKKEYIAR